MLKLLRRDEKGFTLVELMMVIVILGVLAGVAVPMMNNMRKNALASKLGSYADSLGTALLMEKSLNDDFELATYIDDDKKTTTLIKVSGDEVDFVTTNPGDTVTKNTLYVTMEDKKFVIEGYAPGQTGNIIGTKEFSFE